MDRTTAEIAKSVATGLKVSAPLPVWEWCERHVLVDKTSPMPGRWRLDNSPWVKGFMQAFQDPTVNDISVMCSAQSSKTQTIISLVCWAIAEDPGPMLWVLAAQDEAKTFSRQRLRPTLHQCEPVVDRLPLSRHEDALLEVNFPASPLVLTGADSPSKLQSKPMRYLWLDEVRNYPAGALEMVLKRTRAYWNAKRVIISTPDMTDDWVDRSFQAGDQRKLHVVCIHCGASQPLVWGLVKWDTNEATKTAGDYNYDELARTVRLECGYCKQAIYDRPDQRRELARTHQFVAANQNAPANKRSFSWNALIPPWVRWSDCVQEFLEAKKAFRLGAIEPLKAFINETLGEPWSEGYFFEGEDRTTYEVGTELAGEVGRFLTIDVQLDHFWALGRAWAKGADSRRIAWRQLTSWGDVLALQQELKIPSRRVLVDSGYRTGEVYQACAKYGWLALKGTDDDGFYHSVRRHGKSVLVRRSYSEPRPVDAHVGTAAGGRKFCNLIKWSNPLVKDRLRRLLEDGKMQVPDREDPLEKAYKRQMAGEYRKQIINKQTGARKWIWYSPRGENHARDCEAMQVLGAILLDIVPDAALRVVQGKSNPTTSADAASPRPESPA